jgi:hypothetical protein
MADIDVSELILDPDFSDSAILVRRAQTVNAFGETVLTNTTTAITAVIQNGFDATLTRVAEGAQLSDGITVYYRGELFAESENGYADIIIWRNRQYQVKIVDENYINYGVGFTRAGCELIRPNNDG